MVTSDLGESMGLFRVMMGHTERLISSERLFSQQLVEAFSSNLFPKFLFNLNPFSSQASTVNSLTSLSF